MRRMLAYFVTISLAGCFGLFDSSADRIVGKYNIGWIDREAIALIEAGIDAK